MAKSVKLQILEEFTKPRFRHSGIPKDMFGLPAYAYIKKYPSFKYEFSKLKREGLIEKDSEQMRLTKKGQEYIKRRQSALTNFYFKFPKSTPKSLLIMFDIPEPKKAEREWFRFHLKKFGFVMVQRSVWVGPSPLPRDFMNYINEIKLKDCIKTFKLAKAYSSQT